MRRQAGSRQTPAKPDGAEPKPEAQNAAYRGGNAVGNAHHISANHSGCACQRGESVQIRAKHLGDFSKEYVPHHAAANARQHAEQRGHDRVQPTCDSLMSADDREERQSDRVEVKDRRLQFAHPSIEEKRKQPGDDGDEQVIFAGKGGRWYCADQNIARDAAKVSGDEGQDKYAKDVEPTIDGGKSTADGKDKRAAEVEDRSEGFN